MIQSRDTEAPSQVSLILTDPLIASPLTHFFKKIFVASDMQRERLTVRLNPCVTILPFDR